MLRCLKCVPLSIRLSNVALLGAPGKVSDFLNVQRLGRVSGSKTSGSGRVTGQKFRPGPIPAAVSRVGKNYELFLTADVQTRKDSLNETEAMMPTWRKQDELERKVSKAQ